VISISITAEGKDDSQPARNIFEAAERGQIGFVVKAVERTLDYDINQRVGLLCNDCVPSSVCTAYQMTKRQKFAFYAGSSFENGLALVSAGFG
jgi:hypothetical protein